MARFLIDSHIFLWSIDAPERLLQAEASLLRDSSNEIAVSVVTFWELSLKLGKGGLVLSPGKATPDDGYFARHATTAGFMTIPIEAPETEYVRRLPEIHRDPFDRLLIAQALLSGRSIVTRDSVFSEYPGVRVFGA